jgi:hypothetical protein
MASLHHSNKLFGEILIPLIPALVEGDVHPRGIVHEHAFCIRLLSNQRLDEAPHIGMTAQQLFQGPVLSLQAVVGKEDSLILLG